MTAPRPVAFHHLWVGDDRHAANWKTPFEEHFNALADAGFAGDVYVGLVGGPEQRGGAARYLNGHWPFWELLVQAEEGFEMVTLNVMHQWAQRADTDPATPVLYTHGKGSFQASDFADAWRRNMTRHLVTNWRDCVMALRAHDAVGCHWLSHEEYPESISPNAGIFGGNYWWANAGYIASLPPIGWGNRWCAEGWIGLGNPKVKCVFPGWPNY